MKSNCGVPNLRDMAAAFALAWALTWLSACATETAPRAAHLKLFAQCDQPHNNAQTACHVDENPSTIWVETAHTHDLSIVPLESRGPIEVRSTNTAVADLASDGPVYTIHGRGLGVTELEIIHHARDHRDLAVVMVRGVSPRITVVGWINGEEIVPNQLAPNAGPLVREVLSKPTTCMFALYQWLKRSGGKPYAIRTADDALYAKAMLVKASSNPPPPPSLPDGYQNSGEYKLLNEVQLSLGNDGAFDAEGLPRSALMGRTAEPCGLMPEEARQLDFLAIAGEKHKFNGEFFLSSREDSIVHVNETRINKFAQAIETNLTDPNRLVGDLTPWIWSGIRVDRAGNFSVCTQMFPTYSIYVDGKLAFVRNQSDLATFLKLDHNSQIVPEQCR